MLWPAITPPVWADDLPARLTGTFGDVWGDHSCATNPHAVTFSADGTRASFEWSAPITTYLGEPGLRAGYDVLSQDGAGIVMALDGEQRLDAAGAPVIWILRPAQGIDGYCWGRPDWPVGRCVGLSVRCKTEVPLG